MSDLSSVGCALASRISELRIICVEELSRILDLRPTEFDCKRSFDDYGLDSIDAVVALGAISERLGIDLPPELLFVNRTLESVLNAVSDIYTSKRPVGEKTGFFWFPGGGILDEPLVINFRALIRDLPAWEIINVGSWVKWRHDKLTVDELVSAALAQIQSSAPSGPLLLAGDSQGGQLAYATALAAANVGREISGLVLFDSAPDYQVQFGSLPIIITRFLALFVALVRVHDRRSFADYRGFVAWHAFELLLAILSPTNVLALVERLPSGFLSHPRVNRRLQRLTFGKLWSAWLREKRAPLDCPAVLLRSDEPGFEDFGWATTLPQLAISFVPGGHRTMFDADRAPTLAETFRRIVATLMSRSAPLHSD